MGVFFDNGYPVLFSLLPLGIFFFLGIEVLFIKFLKRKKMEVEKKYGLFMVSNLANVVAAGLLSLMVGGIFDGLSKLFTANVGSLIVVGIILLVIAIKSVVFFLFVVDKD